MLDYDTAESFDKTSENLSVIPDSIPSHVKVSFLCKFFGALSQQQLSHGAVGFAYQLPHSRIVVVDSSHITRANFIAQEFDSNHSSAFRKKKKAHRSEFPQHSLQSIRQQGFEGQTKLRAIDLYDNKLARIEASLASLIGEVR
jgi:hypothetical protein